MGDGKASHKVPCGVYIGYMALTSSGCIHQKVKEIHTYLIDNSKNTPHVYNWCLISIDTVGLVMILQGQKFEKF